jgi:hypothetical protein
MKKICQFKLIIELGNEQVIDRFLFCGGKAYFKNVHFSRALQIQPWF